MKQDYKKTTYACFIGYIVRRSVNSFVPLLFVTFQKIIPDSADEDHTAYHNQFCDTASDRSAFGRVH